MMVEQEDTMLSKALVFYPKLLEEYRHLVEWMRSTLRPSFLSRIKGVNSVKTSAAGHHALMSCMAAAMLAGCGGSQPPIGAPGAMPQTIAALTRPNVTYEVLFSFGSNVYGYDGTQPVAGLIAVNGAFYGTTEYGGAAGYAHGDGTVFRLTATGKEVVLYSFTGSPDGAVPVADLVAVNGTLYGTTSEGGTYNGGTVFSITRTGKEKVLHSFGNATDGTQPRAGLIAFRTRLYGTTYEGGAYGKGTVFTISKTGSIERVLHSFGTGTDGANPLATLVNVNGSLFGTTQVGGHGLGTVFKISTTGRERVLHRFKGPDGAYPYAGLLASSAALYGTTGGGGTADSGTVFSISTKGTDERVLHSFSSDGSDGIYPGAAVTMVDAALYGTTSAGGADGDGTVFRVTTSGKERVLHSFGSYQYDGTDPLSGLTEVNGTLYGTTYGGGVNLPSCPRSDGYCTYGTIFSLQP